MKNSWISKLLIILVALQSVVAVADIHLDHPDLNPLWQHEKSPYSQSEHENLSDLSIDNLAPSDVQSVSDTSSAIDCQHCCHCHSPQFNFLGSLFTDPVITGREKHLLDLRSSAPSSLASQLFKPPRA